MALLVMASPQALAQRQAPEAELKAAILSNMMLFVDWPNQQERAADRLTICFMVPEPLTTALAQLDGKLIRGKPLRILKVDMATIGACNALYIAPVEAATLPQLISRLQEGQVLLVGDSPGYLQQGVMINLEIADGRVIFDVNLRAVRKAGLSVSSKALKLARQVQE